MKKIRFLNLSVTSKKEITKYIMIFKKFLKKGVFVLGKDVEIFEKKMCKFLNQNYCLGVSSGTNALHVALKALGIKQNDEVIVPCLSWYSTFTSVVSVGAIPVAADIDDDLHINQNDIIRKINKKTKAIIYVHFTGLFKPLNKLKKICKKKRIFLIEDCAQSFGAKFKNFRPGNFSDIAAYSMNPMKVFASIGDAGLIATGKKSYHRLAQKIRYAGVDMTRDDCVIPSLNNKIDTLSAVILNYRIKYLKKIIKIRIRNAKIYNNLLCEKVIKPKFYGNYQHVYYTYVIRVKANQRNKLIKYLKINGIETKIQHNKLIYNHSGLKKFNKRYITFKGEQLKKEILCLPIHEKLTPRDIKYICSKINSFKF